MWEFNGTKRPTFAEQPKEFQESVWDYPRPPIAEKVAKHILVKLDSLVVAETNEAIRILETASPPSYYLPPNAINIALIDCKESSFCEWKGKATYLGIDNVNTAPIGWVYRNPSVHFSSIQDYIGFYPGRIECFLDAERVRPQPGIFYGGWVTDTLAGPFKGEPGTGWW